MKIIKIILLNLLMLSIALGASLEEDSKGLLTKSFKKKQITIEKLTINYKNDERLESLLQKMLVGELLYLKKDKSIVSLESKKEDEYLTKNFFTNKDLEVKSKYDFKKIKINNKLRSVIKSSLAKINLFSSDIDTRFKSAKNLLNNLDKENEALLNEALAEEKDDSVKEVLEEASTILIAKYGTGNQKLEAVKKLGDFLSPKSLEILNQIKETSKIKKFKQQHLNQLLQLRHQNLFMQF